MAKDDEMSIQVPAFPEKTHLRVKPTSEQIPVARELACQVTFPGDRAAGRSGRTDCSLEVGSWDGWVQKDWLLGRQPTPTFKHIFR